MKKYFIMKFMKTKLIPYFNKFLYIQININNYFNKKQSKNFGIK